MKLLTTREVAELAGCSEATVLRAARGKVPRLPAVSNSTSQKLFDPALAKRWATTRKTS